tara:strand:- start:954 stop:1148 length:195 start_codon:yes stop_codon:yes gene_type:complete
MKLKAEEVVEAIARLDHENKQKFANILVTKWSTLAGHISSMIDAEMQDLDVNGNFSAKDDIYKK